MRYMTPDLHCCEYASPGWLLLEDCSERVVRGGLWYSVVSPGSGVYPLPSASITQLFFRLDMLFLCIPMLALLSPTAMGHGRSGDGGRDGGGCWFWPCLLGWVLDGGGSRGREGYPGRRADDREQDKNEDRTRRDSLYRHVSQGVVDARTGSVLVKAALGRRLETTSAGTVRLQRLVSCRRSCLLLGLDWTGLDGTRNGRGACSQGTQRPTTYLDCGPDAAPNQRVKGG